MLYLKSLAAYQSPSALKKPGRSQQYHCLQFAESASLFYYIMSLILLEFAARVPVAGSAYQFTYLSIGEFWAFLVGWNVALEHTIYVSAIAKTCSR